VVPDANFAFGGSGGNRTVTVRPATDQYGPVDIHDYRWRCRPAASPAPSSGLTINPVNDPPTLGSLDPLTISEDAGLQTVMLSNLTSGAFNELQSLNVTVETANPAC